MYNFKDTVKSGGYSKYLSPVSLNFGGKFFEDYIDDYQTITVFGRETLSQEIESEAVLNGEIITGTRLPARTIVVKYRMAETENDTFQEKFKALRKILTSDSDVEFSFVDNPTAHYFGRLSEMETVDETQNDVISSFTLYCADPFKYSALVQTTGSVSIDTFYKTLPESIQVTTTSAVSVVTITDGTHTITINGAIASGAVVLVDFKTMTLKVNDVESTYMIALNSDFENFYLKNGTTISSPQGNVILKMKERWL